MTGSFNILKLLTLLCALFVMSFTAACGENKKQPKAQNGVAQSSEDKDGDDDFDPNPIDQGQEPEEDGEDEDLDDEGDDLTSDDPSNLIAQIMSLLTGQGGSGLDISQITALLGAGGGAGGLDIGSIISLITGAGSGSLDPSALQGLLGGMDITQLQTLLSQLQP